MCRGMHWDSVHKPDLRLVLWFRQVAVAACVDGFVWDQWMTAVCMLKANHDALTTRPYLTLVIPEYC